MTAKQLTAVLCVGIAGRAALGRSTGARGALERGGIAAGSGLTGLGTRAAATAFALTIFGIASLTGGTGFSGAFVVFADVRDVVADLGSLAVLVSATLLTSTCIGAALGPCGRAFHSQARAKTEDRFAVLVGAVKEAGVVGGVAALALLRTAIGSTVLRTKLVAFFVGDAKPVKTAFFLACASLTIRHFRDALAIVAWIGRLTCLAIGRSARARAIALGIRLFSARADFIREALS